MAFVHLTQADVVRHRIVREIVNAYDRFAAAQAGISASRRPWAADERS